MNPDGSFDRIPSPPEFPYIVNPYVISENGTGRRRDRRRLLLRHRPFLWNKDLGTIDFQLFLIGQGLDELYFWYLTSINAISGNGRIVAGQGQNPDGKLEGWIVDINQVLVCRNPEAAAGKGEGGDTYTDCTDGYGENCRTMRVDYELVGDPSELGSCEFKRSGGTGARAGPAPRTDREVPVGCLQRRVPVQAQSRPGPG